MKKGGSKSWLIGAGIVAGAAVLLKSSGASAAVPDSSRTPDALAAVIDGLDVTGNPKYQPANGTTFCNVFVQDVMAGLGLELPPLSANDTGDWLASSAGAAAGWTEVDEQTAQDNANAGGPVIASWVNPNGHGHMAVVRPGSINANGPEISAAGASLLADAHMMNSFGNNGPVLYYAHA